MSENNGSSMMLGLLLGAVVGAGAALLLAPRSGSETRRRISDSARNMGDSASDQVDRVRNLVAERADDVGAAIDAGKEAFRHNVENSPFVKDRA